MVFSTSAQSPWLAPCTAGYVLLSPWLKETGYVSQSVGNGYPKHLMHLLKELICFVNVSFANQTHFFVLSNT